VKPLNGDASEAIDQETLDRLHAELSGLDKPDALESLIRQFVESTPGGVAAIKAAVDAGDAEGVSRGAHSLRGSSATFGATRLATVCEALERAGRDRGLDQARALVTELEEAAVATEAALERQLTPGLRT
jgi:HPt (histidine-containing phosphotransfer) domain-containing protein